MRASAARKLLLAAGCGAVLCFIHAPVRAQDEPAQNAQKAPVVTAPQLMTEPEVLYPEGATGDAVVVLQLVVDASGAVRQVEVMQGDEPFASRAVEVARTWQFSPATRDGQAIAARIRFELRFQEPKAVEEPQEPPPTAPETHATLPTPLAPQTSAPVARATGFDQAIDVLVQGDKPPPAVRSLTRAEVREMPGAFGDPFRAIDALPGVVPLVSGVPFFYIRGAPPGNVGYFLDGIRVPLLYHVALGPGVIHPGIVDRVDLYPGGYPAQYGRYSGGIVAAETTPPRPELHGEATVRLIDTGALVEMPLADGSATVLAAGRYSYTAALLSLVSPEVTLEYWDYQLRANKRLNARHDISVFSFGAYDYLGDDEGGTTRTLVGTEFHRVDLRHLYTPSSDTSLRTAVMVGLDRTRNSDDEEDDGLYMRDRMVGLRSDLKHRASSSVHIHAGADVTFDYYDVNVPPDDEGEAEEEERGHGPGSRGGGPDGLDDLISSRTDVAMGVYGSLILEVAPGITVTPGLRTDLYASEGAVALGVDPRLAARFELSPTVRLLHTVGIAHQPPSFVVPIPGLQVAGLEGGLQRSIQSSAGVQADLSKGTRGSVTLFHNVFLDLTDGLSMARLDTEMEDRFDSRSLGRAVGVEVELRRSLTRKLGGFLAYTLSRSERWSGRYTFVSAFDRTHVLHAALSYDLGRRWKAGSRFLFYTGAPGELTGLAVLFPREVPRAPSFHRFDARVEKKWPIGSSGAWWAVVVEVLNATLQKEVIKYECDLEKCTQEAIGPVTIPSIGLEAAF